MNNRKITDELFCSSVKLVIMRKHQSSFLIAIAGAIFLSHTLQELENADTIEPEYQCLEL